MKYTLILISACFLVGMAYLFISPVDLNPQAWTAPEDAGFTGAFTPNKRLSQVQRIEVRESHGPEDVDVDRQGRVYGGLQNGHIIRTTGKETEVFADTGGRPLGLAFAGDDLIVADAYKGLLRITPDRRITVLATEADGLPFAFTDDVDVAPDGRIYFTDASYKYQQKDYQADGLEHQPNGRFLVYDPATKAVKTLVRDLYFPNGVAVSQDGDFVLVNETWNYRVLRYWIRGEKAGIMEPFISNLPGFPDGISRGESGTFWLALVSPRNPLLDSLGPWPGVRKILARLPKELQPDAVPYACVIGLDSEGRVVHNLQDPDAEKYGIITSIEEKNGRLWLGSLKEKAIGYYQL